MVARISPFLLLAALVLVAVFCLRATEVSSSYASGGDSAAVTIITVDPTSQDQQGCGSSDSPCASVLGALLFNNLTDPSSNSSNNSNNGSYGLLLKSGVYQGVNNQNISIPSNVVWINGTESVVFQGSAMNLTTVVNSTYSYNTTMVTPIFNVSSSLAISGVTFSGEFYYSYFQTNVIVVTDGGYNTTNSSASTFLFADVSFVNISPELLYGNLPCINAVLQAGSQLTLLRVSTNYASLVSASSMLDGCPPANYAYPFLSITSLSVSNVPPQNIQYFSFAQLITTSNVNLLLIDTSIVNSTVGSITGMGYGGVGCFQTSLPTTLVSGFVMTDSTIGTGISAVVANIFNVSVTNSRIAYGAVLDFYWGDASFVNISNNSFILANTQVETLGLVLVGWRWMPCVYSDPGCGQLPSGLPVATYLTGIVIQNNANLSAFDFAWDSGNAPLPSTPFTSSLAVVYIESSVVSNNTYLHWGGLPYSKSSGVAIQATTTYTAWQGSSGTVNSDGTFFNQIVVSNSVLNNNEADSSGGAIILLDTSLKLINTTVQGNIANLTAEADVFLPSTSGESCFFSSKTYYGGGGIFASYYSQIEILNGSAITNNQVIATNSDLYVFMSGGIFCCPNNNVTVVLDNTSTLGNNSAPLVNDLSCHNSTFHSKIPICNFVGSVEDMCEYGETSALPIILISGFVVLVVAILIFVAIRIHVNRKRNQYALLE